VYQDVRITFVEEGERPRKGERREGYVASTAPDRVGDRGRIKENDLTGLVRPKT
jgi:hypothetical protein